jgi:glycosyltransferase involved in cell wall biosynthesis
MRVLLLNTEYPPLGGGAGNAARCLLESFTRLHPDLAVDALCASPGKTSELTLSENVRVHLMDIRKSDNLHYQTLGELTRFLLRGRGRVSRMLRENRYDLIHAFFALPTGLLALARAGSLPTVVSLRGSDVPGYNERFRWLYPLTRPLFRRVCQKAGAIVANSEGLKALALKTIPGLPVDVIPNGVDVMRFSPAPRTPDGRFRLLYSGRLIRRKGLTLLLEGFARFHKRYPESLLTLAGSGNLDAPLWARVQDLGLGRAARFTGALDREALLPYYRESDAFILPSLNEGMSNSLLEAMACGLPVIVTDTGGTAELVRGNGLVVRTLTPEGLANAMETLMTVGDRRLNMGITSRAIAREFSWDKSAELYYQTYRRVAKD